jgi:phenylacetate-CoA ligase
VNAIETERENPPTVGFWDSPQLMTAGIEQILEPIELQHLRRDRRVRALLAYAKEHSPWHARRLAHVDVDAVSGDDLTMIPPMTKADLMANWDEIVTDRRLTLRDANEHLDRLRRGEWGLLHDRYGVLASGGSTGTRGVFLHDTAVGEHAQVPDFVAAMDRYWAWQAAVEGGLPTPVRVRIMSTSPFHVSAVWRWLYGDGGWHYLSASSSIAELVEALNAIRPDVLCTYPSIGHRLALEARDGRLDVRPRRVTTSAEPLLPEAREAMRSYLTDAVTEEYAATEAYMTAWNNVNGGMHLVEDDGVYEPVGPDGEPVAAGVPSSALLITNIFSYALPLIRYELTDEVVLDPGPNPGPLPGRRVLSVTGRRDDWFHYRVGAEVHPHTFRAVLSAHSAIVEYQVRQTPRGADVVIAAVGDVEMDVIATDLTSALARAGLDNPDVTVTRCGQLPRHAETAKLRRFVPLT